MKFPVIRTRRLLSASATAALALTAPAFAATLTWNGVAGTNWDPSPNPSPWTLSGANPDADTIPDSNDEVSFTDVGTVSAASGTSSVMNLATPTIGRFSVLGTGIGWHGLDLNGATLSVTGSPEGTTGSFSVGLYTGASSATRAQMAIRNGSLVIGTASENLASLNRSFNIGFKATTAASQQVGVLDLSGLASFAVHVAMVRVGVADNSGPSIGQVTLAPTSLIRTTLATIGALNGGASPVADQASRMTLGSVANTLQIGTLSVGSSKSSGTLDVAGNNTGTVTLGGATAGSKAAVNVGVNHISNTIFGTIGDFDMAKAASFAANISTLSIGVKPTGTAGAGGAIGSFRTAAGTNAITIDSVTMASSAVSTAPALGLLTLQGSGSATIGTMVVANGNTAAGATAATTGTVNQTGMSVTVSALTLTGSNTLGTGTYNLTGGELAVGSFAGGSGISRFNWGNATLRAINAGSLMGGIGAVTITGAAVFTSANDISITVPLAGSGAGSSLTKLGSGTLGLGGASTYAGGTTVAEGTLRLVNSSGSATGSGTVTVSSGATLLSSGSRTAVAGEVHMGGRLSLSSFNSTLTTGGLTLADGAVFSLQVDPAKDRMSQLISNGAVSLGAGATLDVGQLGTYSGDYTESYTILLNTTATEADLDQYFVGLRPDDNGVASFEHGLLKYTIQYNAAINDAVGNDIVVTFQSVPEPAGMAAIALAGGALLRRRHRRGLRGSTSLSTAGRSHSRA